MQGRGLFWAVYFEDIVWTWVFWSAPEEIFLDFPFCYAEVFCDTFHIRKNVLYGSKQCLLKSDRSISILFHSGGGIIIFYIYN